MSILKTALACALAGAMLVGQLQNAAAAPMPTNVGVMKAMVPESTTQVFWRGGWGWGVGALAAGAIIGGAIASAPYGYYCGPTCVGYPYYGGSPYGYGYGYAPAYGYGYGYAPAYGSSYYGYPGSYGYRPYYGYRTGYYRPYRSYYRSYGYW